MGADDPLKPHPDDELYKILRGAAGSIPVIGSFAQEILAGVIADPAMKRRDEAILDILERVRQLEIAIEDLKKNTNFQTSFIQASQIILRTTDKEKIEYLKNAAVNSALFGDLSDTIRHIFMQRLDQLTALHIQLLTFLDDPSKYPAPQGLLSGGLMNVIEAGFPGLRGQHDLIKTVLNELEQMGFASGTNPNVTMTASGLTARRTTNLGRSFLEFIARHD
jgi:hypothetical protein